MEYTMNNKNGNNRDDAFNPVKNAKIKNTDI
jgi:hypothetical protein